MPRISLVLLLLLSACAAPAEAAEKRFSWRGPVAAGRTIYVRNLNGAIRAVPSDGGELSLVAVKRAQDGANPDDVDIQVVPHDGTVTICALWPAPERRCGPRGEYQAGDVKNTRIDVELVLSVPRGLSLDLATTNGAIDARGLDATVTAATTNGDIEVASAGAIDVQSTNGGIKARTGAGAVNAVTTNGAIDAAVGALATGGPIELSTTNGSVRVQVPAGLDADLEASVVHGSITAGVPLTRTEARDRSHLRARLGAGGRRLALATVNGSISIASATR